MYRAYFSRDAYFTNSIIAYTPIVNDSIKVMDTICENRSTNSRSLVTCMHGLIELQYLNNRFEKP